VKHLDVTGEQIEQACAILKKVCTTQGMLAIVKCGQSPFSELFGQALASEAVRRMLAAFNRNAPLALIFFCFSD
jgi:hypothetical protein